MKIKTAGALLSALCLLLAGCVSNPAFERGRAALAAGQNDTALRLLEEAKRIQPDDHEVRRTYYRARETVLAQWLIDAERARDEGDMQFAAQSVAAVLRIDPNEPRALALQSTLEVRVRHDKQVADARAAYAKKDYPLAENLLRRVLAENPRHREARSLLEAVSAEMPVQGREPPPGLKTPFAKPITLEFRDAILRNVFDAMSNAGGLNFVFDRDVRPDVKVTISVKNTSLEEVLRLVLLTNQLDYRALSENTVLIFPKTPAKQREYQELITRTFFLANAEVKQVQTLVKTVVKTKDVYIDEKLNVMVVKDTPEAVRLIERLLDSLDVAESEVMLDLEVMEVSRSKLLDLGLRFPDSIGYGQLNPGTTTTTIVNGVTQSVVTPGGQVSQGVVDLRNRGALTTFVSNPALVLNLKNQDGNGNLLANPRIRVKNKEKAKIHIGEKLPVFTTTSTANVGVSAAVSYLDVGLKLEVEPQIYLDEDVGIKLTLEVSSIVREVPGPQQSLAYQVGTRSASTVLRLHDGETQVLAGLINDEERSSASHLPGLGDLPLIGRLFTSRSDTKNKTEIVLLMTPRVVRGVARPALGSAQLGAGTEADVGAPALALKSSPPGQGMRLQSRGNAVAPSAMPGLGVPGLFPAQPPPAAVPSPVPVALEAPASVKQGAQISATVSLPVALVERNMQALLAFDPEYFEATGPGGAGPGMIPVSVRAGAQETGQASVSLRARKLAPEGTVLRLDVLSITSTDGGPLAAQDQPTRTVRIEP
ncbi:MAG: secretin and TonB N-terminal domain-containing protein [Rhodocyclaceae bacterium]|nr:secretin and TonB N-terminal domain-containing protein [Rhodocyclaceae bacterium]MBX3667288.1 secretin and TonB N-terminal domain-containing protein [Rhodocyclaceae bacterium]